MKALYPGSFDPLTNGHMDVIERVAATVDHLVVAVGINSAKTPTFTAEQRCHMIQESVAHLRNVTVMIMEGTVIETTQNLQCQVIIKGVRTSADVEAESVQARVNRDLSGVETFLLPASGEFAHISSTVVREMMRWGMDTSRYVPQPVHHFINENRSYHPQ